MRNKGRRTAHAITPELIEKIKELTPGRFQYEVAQIIGVSQTTVARVQRKYAIPHFSRAEGRRLGWARARS